MYISRLHLCGYKNTYEKSEVTLNRGLNVLLGENGCGKTAIINALRMLFREVDSRYSFSSDDFYCSTDKNSVSSEIEISADLTALSEDEKIAFLSWCDSNFEGHLHLQISENPIKPGTSKWRYWGGQASAGIFEDSTFDWIECIYLPPLRDAESKLSAGKRSRIAALLKKQYGEDAISLVETVKSFNNSIVQGEEGRDSGVSIVQRAINKKIDESLGKQLGQSINLQFTETSFNKIVENIRMVFFPGSGETDITKFRDLATNSLGYNNLLYIATVLSELELVKESDVFTVLLIEEPEAHLHPQLQIKFIKYLESLSTTLPNAQIIVSTHSPVLASSVSIDKLIVITGTKTSISATTISEKDFQDPLAEKYINRWLDVTKSTMLFSRGIILVEGIAEALVIPRLAELVLKKYNDERNDAQKLGVSLDEMGISIININGINFKYFMKLFGNFQGSSGPCIPIYCAGITDRDPEKSVFPKIGEAVEGQNPALEYAEEINSTERTRLYTSPLKTFEYDLAIYNPVCFANVLKQLWRTEDGPVCNELDEIINRGERYDSPSQLAEDAKYIYKHIEDSSVGKGIFAQVLAEQIPDDFIIPQYIINAVLWACGGIQDDQA